MRFRTRLTASFALLILLSVSTVYVLLRGCDKSCNLLILLALFILLVILALLFANRLTRPLERLLGMVGGGREQGGEDKDGADEFELLEGSLERLSTELQSSRESLSSIEERFHALFVAMNEGAALHRLCYDQNRRPVNYLILEVNPRYEEILGVGREKVIGRVATEVYSCSRAPYLEEYAAVVASGKPCRFDIYYEPLQLHLGISCCRIGVDSFATIFTDITTRVWHEETLRNTMAQLKQANEAKSRFLAVMSHEIRTPLNGITGMVQLLHDMEMPKLQREFLDNIDSSAETLLGVVDDILDFSKIEAGHLSIEKIPFDPSNLLHTALRVMRLRAQAKGLQLNLEIDGKMPPLLAGDPHRINQILTNLVNNAIKFTAAGEVTVTADAKRLDSGTALLKVSVTDSGIGMDSETQKRIFDPFTQADSSTTRRFGGTGLGLAISKQLVELMHGAITVSSSPGSGSCFSFSIPLEVKQSKVPEQPLRAVTTIDHPLRVLVAEDQPVNQRFVAEILRKQGHTPLLANNGQEAVDIWKREPVDLALMDIQMPVMDGLRALAVIRAAEHESKQHLPIIALTAHAIVGDRERLLNAGFDAYLAKPLQVGKLFEEMARVLEMIGKERRSR